ncbi:hypothetical protein KH5_07630 [Urechidicola sp. KH5]
MKKITLFLFLLTVSFGYSQIVETFDPVPAAGVWESNSGEPMTTVDVVDATVDFGTYGKVGRMISDASGLPWQNAILTMTDFSIDVTTTKTITANVYYNGGSAINILGKLTEGIGQPNQEVGVDHPGTGWSLLTWDFTGVATGEYNKISFFINRAAGGAWEGSPGSTVSREVWIDNITAPQGSAVVADPVPATGPTDPIARDVANYISFYNGIASPSGDEYVNESGVTFDSFGGSSIEGDVVLADGNTVKKYKNHLFSGIGNGSWDVSGMQKLHIDVWSPGFTSFRIKLEDGSGGNLELDVPGSEVQNSWNSYDIDLSAYSGSVNLANLKWIVLVSYTPPGELLYVDNVYFWKESVDPSTDATLSALEVDSSPLAGFNASTLDYDFQVPSGTVAVPQITTATPTQVGASVVITQAPSVPGTASVLVTATDNTTTATYTINIIETGPSAAAPAPPARAAGDVLSVFSPAYTDEASSGVLTFAGATLENFTVDTFEDTRVLTAGPGGGAQYGYFFGNGTGFDLTDFTTLHIDVWVDDAGDIGSVLTIQLQNFDSSTGAFQHNISTNLAVNTLGAGAWIGGDIDLSTFANIGAGADNIQQIQLIAQGPAFGPIYFTNLYFHKNTTLGTSEFEIEDLSVYPNPTTNVWNVRTTNEGIEDITIFNVFGKELMRINIENDREAQINAENFKSGIYMANIRTANGVKTLKLIKK